MDYVYLSETWPSFFVDGYFAHGAYAGTNGERCDKLLGFYSLIPMMRAD